MAADGAADTQPLSDSRPPDHDVASSTALPVEFSAQDLEQQLLRGVRFHELVAGLGKHWAANSLATEVGRSWAFSARVDRNDYFVSHSWKSSRWLKYLALLALANSTLAAAGGTVAVVVARIYCHYHATFVFFNFIQVGDMTWKVPQTLLPSSAGLVVGTVLFVQGHRLRQLVEESGWLRHRTAFLDKLVIHQDDPALQKKGIELLGAFVKSSDVFLVLWSEHYLSRLWCSYEVAVFLFLRSLGHQGKILVWPLPVAAIMAAKMAFLGLQAVGSVGYWFALDADEISSDLGGSSWLLQYLIVGLPCMIIIVNSILQMNHDVAALDEQVGNYTLSQCGCFSEEDRALVEASVTSWFDPAERNRDNATAKFNDFLRREFESAFRAIFMRAARPPLGLASFIALTVLWSDTFQLIRPHDMPWQTYASLIANSVVQDVCGQMLSLAYQYHAVAAIERCFRCSRYVAVPQHDQTETWQSVACRYVKFALSVVACSLVYVTSAGLTFAPACLPLPANVVVSLGFIVWTIFEFR